MSKVSIIIPVYNKEKYIVECLESLMYQTYSDIEIICIDDGSTDMSGNIIEEFVHHDNRISYFKQENSGAAVARNKGIDKSTGDYLLFLDADDFFEFTMLEEMVKKAELFGADITICNAVEYDDDNNTKSLHKWLVADKVPSEPFNCNDVDNIFEITQSTIWNKLYRKAFIVDNSISFQNLKSNNDTAFSIISLFLAEKIVCIDRCFVNYRKYNDINRIATVRSQYKECCSEAYKMVISRLKNEKIFSEKTKKIINQQMYNSSRYELSFYDNEYEARSFISTMTPLMNNPEKIALKYYYDGFTNYRDFYLFNRIPFARSINLRDKKILFIMGFIRINIRKSES